MRRLPKSAGIVSGAQKLVTAGSLGETPPWKRSQTYASGGTGWVDEVARFAAAQIVTMSSSRVLRESSQRGLTRTHRQCRDLAQSTY